MRMHSCVWLRVCDTEVISSKSTRSNRCDKGISRETYRAPPEDVNDTVRGTSHRTALLSTRARGGSARVNRTVAATTADALARCSRVLNATDRNVLYIYIYMNVYDLSADHHMYNILHIS